MSKARVPQPEEHAEAGEQTTPSERVGLPSASQGLTLVGEAGMACGTEDCAT